MQLSTDRFLTTHAGSLPRPLAVLDLLAALDRDDPGDADWQEEVLTPAVEALVLRQAQTGIDVVSDGEASKISYATYVRHRLTGFEGDSARPTPQDLDDYPAYRDRLIGDRSSATYRRPICTGPIAVRQYESLERDIARVGRALEKAPVVDAFMTAVSPGTIGVFHPNQHYPTYEAYIEALADTMRGEYLRIVESGLVLQVDCPDLAMGRHSRFKQLSDGEFLRYAELHVDALNHALRDVPANRVRLHVCWGNYEGPHVHDIPLSRILPVVLRARPMALVIEGANPRHEHEWEVWRYQRLPDDKVLVPGVIDTSTNYVEHPELVSQRVVRYANLVGRDRVIAGTDCGFGTFAGFGPVHPEIAWAKLRALVEGAAIASGRLWRRAVAVV